MDRRVATPSAPIARIGLLALLAAIPAAHACGGSGKGAQEPREAAADPDDAGDAEPADPVQVSGEQLDAIRSFFDRKARTVARCYADAAAAGEVDKAVRVLMNVRISAEGKLGNIELESTAPSETLTTCLREHAERWVLPAPAHALDYSYTFAFEGL